MQTQWSRSPVDEENRSLADVVLDIKSGVATIRVSGELDFFSSVTLADRLAQAVASDIELAEVDLQQTSFVSLAAFRVLVDAATLLSGRGATLVLRDPPPSLRILDDLLGAPALLLEDRGATTPG